MSEVTKVSSRDELAEVLEKNDKVLVNFSQSVGCVWCKRLEPHFDAAASIAPHTKFVYLDVTEVPEVITEFDFMKTPTVFLFENGERVAEVTARTAMQIASEIKR